MNRAQFLRTPVRDLVKINPDGSVDVEPQPVHTSERTYRDHLAEPTMVVYARDADTVDLPSRLWGGTRWRGLDPVSASIVAASQLRRGKIVATRWE
jgi:hypothetical protein